MNRTPIVLPVEYCKVLRYFCNRYSDLNRKWIPTEKVEVEGMSEKEGRERFLTILSHLCIGNIGVITNGRNSKYKAIINDTAFVESKLGRVNVSYFFSPTTETWSIIKYKVHNPKPYRIFLDNFFKNYITKTMKSKRMLVAINIRRAWWEETIEAPVIEISEVLMFPAKYIFAQRPKRGFPMNEEEYVGFKTPNSVPENKFPVGTYAIRAKNFKKILASLPHFPNKEEAKRTRKLKAKIKK